MNEFINEFIHYLGTVEGISDLIGMVLAFLVLVLVIINDQRHG